MSRASAKSTVGFIPHLSNPGNGEKHHGEPQQPDCPVSVDIMAWKQVVLNRMLTKQDSDERGGAASECRCISSSTLPVRILLTMLS